jgi:tRNA 2-thiocytidine biosynthesis protein TtcA
VGTAIKQFAMIKEGDRVMVGVSGGKDSLTLVNILLYLQRRAPINFHVGVCTVDPQAPEYDPSLLKKYFASLNVPYFYESDSIMENAMACMQKNVKMSICSFCSRMRRGILYNTCRREGYNVLALGQHLDDLSESFVMSAFHNGLLRTMKVNYMNKQRDVRIIRPLCTLRESRTREFAKVVGLPIISENCPACFEAPKERQRVKLMLAAQENLHPNLHQTLLRAMRPLMAIGMEDRPHELQNELNRLLAGEDEDDDKETKEPKKADQNNKSAAQNKKTVPTKRASSGKSATDGASNAPSSVERPAKRERRNSHTDTSDATTAIKLADTEGDDDDTMYV